MSSKYEVYLNSCVADQNSATEANSLNSMGSLMATNSINYNSNTDYANANYKLVSIVHKAIEYYSIVYQTNSLIAHTLTATHQSPKNYLRFYYHYLSIDAIANKTSTTTTTTTTTITTTTNMATERTTTTTAKQTTNMATKKTTNMTTNNTATNLDTFIAMVAK